MTDIPRPKPEPKRGWKKLLLALLVFVVLPIVPQLRAMLPIDETMLLIVPAMAACALVGWWAGGRMLSAVLWLALAIFVTRQDIASTPVFANLLRGWTLLLAGAFGIASLIGPNRSFLSRALTAVAVAFALALLMPVVTPVTFAGAGSAITRELAQRNTEFLEFLNTTISGSGSQWQAWVEKMPSLAGMPEQTATQLDAMSRVGRLMFPSFLALESLAGLALAWALYHRLSRQRIGTPLSPLREFRFNDQFVWGLIIGLVILVVPGFAVARGIGANLVLFFGALYAMRGLGVLAWFMSPGTFATTLVAGAVLIVVPVINVIAILGFMTLGVTALGLGVGDTWADWRNRARSTLS
jgi:hypothetical protein